MTTKELLALVADVAAVLDAAKEASAVPLQWQSSTDFTPEQVKEWMADAVSENVKAGDFTGELHSIAELESGLTVAFTGCGPKSAANAKFLIWCAHFILKHGENVMDALRAQPAGGGGKVYACDFCGSDYTDAKYCCQRRREYLNMHGQHEPTPPESGGQGERVAWAIQLPDGTISPFGWCRMDLFAAAEKLLVMNEGCRFVFAHYPSLAQGGGNER